MVFGNPNTERIQLNDDSLWPESPGDWNEPEGTKEDIKTIRTLLINNQTEAADSLFVSKFSRKRIVRSHQTLGDLYITFKNHDKISHYRRDLDISKAIASVTYQTNKEHQISQEVLVSNPHKVIAIKLSSNTPDGLNAKLSLNRPKDRGEPTVNVFTNKDNLLIMQGKVTQRGGKVDALTFTLF